MKKFIAMLAILVLGGVAMTTPAFAVSSSLTVSASILQGTATLGLFDASTAGNAVTTVGFGTVPLTSTTHRTKETTPTGGVWVDYFSGGGTFEIRAWYDNYPTSTSDPTKTLAGLKATVGSNSYYWAHKIWCTNFGGTGTPPDPTSDANWTGTNAVYKWVYEKAYKVDGFGNTGLPAGYPAGTYKDDTRSKLVWYYPTGTATAGALDARLPSRFRVDVAIDSLDAGFVGPTSTAYSGSLVFDLTQAP